MTKIWLLSKAYWLEQCRRRSPLLEVPILSNECTTCCSERSACSSDWWCRSYTWVAQQIILEGSFAVVAPETHYYFSGWVFIYSASDSVVAVDDSIEWVGRLFFNWQHFEEETSHDFETSKVWCCPARTKDLDGIDARSWQPRFQMQNQVKILALRLSRQATWMNIQRTLIQV